MRNSKYVFTLVPLLFSIANALRGSGEVGKIYVYIVSNALFGALLYYYAPEFWYIAICTLTLDWVGNSFGWGAFFPNGRYDSKEGGFKPARWIANIFFDGRKSTVKWQVTAMSFRFFLTFGLGCIGLAFLMDNLLYLAAAPIYLLSGFMYRIPFMFTENKHSLRIAELLNGLVVHGSTRALIIYLLSEGYTV